MNLLKVCAVVLFSGAIITAEGAQKRPMVLQIMWDGMRADCLENCHLPNLRRLAEGRWMKGYNGAWSYCSRPIEDARPYSFANHASHLNGVTAAKHGVYYNHETVNCRAKEWPAWPTRLLDAQPQKKVVFYFTSGVAYHLCPDKRVEMKNMRHDEVGKASDLSARYSGDQAPDAAILFIDDPDVQGHANGFFPVSANYRKAVEANDVQLGKILDAISSRKTFDDEDWLILMAADHGGYKNMHGWLDDHSRTAPMVIAGRRVINGQMYGFPRGVDLPPTALAHFGIDTSKMNLDGCVVGTRSATWGAASKLSDALTWYYPVAAKTKELVNFAPNGPGSDVIGDKEYFNPLCTGDAIFKTPYLLVAGAEDVLCAASLHDSAEHFIAPRPAFTISFWARLRNFEGNPVIFGNKDLSREGTPGFVLCQGGRTERAPKGVAVVYGTPYGRDVTVGTFDIEFGKWTYYALVGTSEGHLWLCQGRSDGMFHWICAKADNALLGSGLPLHIGQDGRGGWKWNFGDSLDDIAIWKRSLTIQEIKQIYLAGRDKKELKDICFK